MPESGRAKPMKAPLAGLNAVALVKISDNNRFFRHHAAPALPAEPLRST